MPPEATNGQRRLPEHQRQQRKEAVQGEIGSIGERRSMSACLRALHHERISADPLGADRLLGTRDRDPDLGPSTMQRVDHRLVRTAETERHDRDPFGHHELELGFPVVIAVAGLAKRRPGACAPRREPSEEVPICAGLGGPRPGDKYVDPDGTIGERPRCADALADGRSAEIPARQKAETACLGYRRRELRCGRTAAKRGQDHRRVELVQDHFEDDANASDYS